MLAVAERSKGDFDRPSRDQSSGHELPIDYLALNEQYESRKALGNDSKARRLRINSSIFFSREPDPALELAFDYVALGQTQEAIKVLEYAIKAAQQEISRSTNLAFIRCFITRSDTYTRKAASWIERAPRTD